MCMCMCKLHMHMHMDMHMDVHVMSCVLHHVYTHTCKQRVHLGEVYASVPVAVVLVEEWLEDPTQARLVLVQ